MRPLTTYFSTLASITRKAESAFGLRQTKRKGRGQELQRVTKPTRGPFQWVAAR